ncbi:hypothetical protein ACFV7R_10050, partial [Streptomyces sp. NPDC059866]|uniref:hypothetical protein n=1 Tax=Streptomyces sp. NPDC059866 TaxID=3346978 RepID=UPI00365B2E73
STGLPTKTEQADLLQAMYGRNGEAPVPIVARARGGDGLWWCWLVALLVVFLVVSLVACLVLSLVALQVTSRFRASRRPVAACVLAGATGDK